MRPLSLRRADDVQVELAMLDPHIRTALKHDGQGRFAAQVRRPAAARRARGDLVCSGCPALAGAAVHAGLQAGTALPGREHRTLRDCPRCPALALGLHLAQVKVPDVYGVFKWVLEYRRLGYSFIELTGAAARQGAGTRS